MAHHTHIDADDLVSFVLGALDSETQRAVEAHLSTGCARCRGECDWLERTITTARADRSIAPPAHVLARAVRLFPVEPAPARSLDTLLRRVRAALLFDSAQQPALSLNAGARGAGEEMRQLLFAVEELDLEINVQTSRRDASGASSAVGASGGMELRGQVFPSGGADRSVTGLTVEAATPSGERLRTVTSPHGEFALELPATSADLLLRVDHYEIELAVPSP